jgi:hypothetical protein
MRFTEPEVEVEVNYVAVGATVSRLRRRLAADDEFGRLAHRAVEAIVED